MIATQARGVALGLAALATLAAPPCRAASESVVYAFQGSPDGARPQGGLIAIGGVLYGTTSQGGNENNGTVFSVTPKGAETVLHVFAGGNDGATPNGGLLSVGGVLYGTTAGGGGAEHGTVYSMTPAGSESVLHAFQGAPMDGAYPLAGLLVDGGNLYGTTAYGGAGDCVLYNGCGTIFKITTAGTEAVTYDFGAGTVAALPDAAIIDAGGTFYGTAADYNCGDTQFGAVYAFAAGVATAIYNFKGGNDGACPQSSLVAIGATLYGTTFAGGAQNAGAVFAVTTAGVEKILHSFGAAKDGGYPTGNLVQVGKLLYGVTNAGGAKKLGTIYSITPAGVEKVVYSFKGKSDGANPLGGLTDVGGVLYGVTGAGGPAGAGTVFAFTP